MPTNERFGRDAHRMKSIRNEKSFENERVRYTYYENITSLKYTEIITFIFKIVLITKYLYFLFHLIKDTP